VVEDSLLDGRVRELPARLRVCQVEVEVAHVVQIAEVVAHLRVVVDELRVHGYPGCHRNSIGPVVNRNPMIFGSKFYDSIIVCRQIYVSLAAALRSYFYSQPTVSGGHYTRP
jgi:hypothetical protein